MPQSQIIRILNHNSNCSNHKSYEIALLTTYCIISTSIQVLNPNFDGSITNSFPQSQLLNCSTTAMAISHPQCLNHKFISPLKFAQIIQ